MTHFPYEAHVCARTSLFIRNCVTVCHCVTYCVESMGCVVTRRVTHLECVTSSGAEVGVAAGHRFLSQSLGSFPPPQLRGRCLPGFRALRSS